VKISKNSIRNSRLRMKLPLNAPLFRKERANRVKRPKAENTKRNIQNIEEGVLGVPLSCGSNQARYLEDRRIMAVGL